MSFDIQLPLRGGANEVPRELAEKFYKMWKGTKVWFLDVSGGKKIVPVYAGVIDKLMPDSPYTLACLTDRKVFSYYEFKVHSIPLVNYPTWEMAVNRFMSDMVYMVRRICKADLSMLVRGVKREYLCIDDSPILGPEDEADVLSVVEQEVEAYCDSRLRSLSSQLDQIKANRSRVCNIIKGGN